MRAGAGRSKIGAGGQGARQRPVFHVLLAAAILLSLRKALRGRPGNHGSRRIPKSVNAEVNSSGEPGAASRYTPGPEPADRSRAQRWADSPFIRDGVIALVAAVLAVSGAAYLDDRRAERDAIRAERLSWRTLLVTADSIDGADLSAVDASSFHVSAKDLSGVNFTDAKLQRARLDTVDLVGATLKNIHADAANFKGSSLRSATMSSADLSDADLSDTDLSGVDLTKAADITGMTITSACYDYRTKFPAPRPPLDWKACWQGYPDDESDITPRQRPTTSTCSYSDLTSTLPQLFQPAYPSQTQACDFLSYLQAIGVTTRSEHLAIGGADSCVAMRRDPKTAYQPLGMDSTFDDDFDANAAVVFAAAHLLCPDTLASFEKNYYR